MQTLIGAVGDVQTALPADGEPDWAAADVAMAEIQRQFDAWVAATSDPVLLERGEDLRVALADMATRVASRDSWGITGWDLVVVLRAEMVDDLCPST